MLFKQLPVYFFIRYFVLMLTSICVILFFRRKKQHGIITRNSVIVTVLIYVLITLSFYFPIENLFITFQTVDEAVNYQSGDSVVAVAEGQQSCCAIVLENGTASSYTHLIIPRNEDGYKLPGFSRIDMEEKSEKTDPVYAMIYHASGSDDYYILVNLFWDDQVESVTDSLGYPVQMVHPQIKGYESHTYTLLSYSNGYPEDYHLWINGEEAVSFE
ncbi:MAG: hypothetical protein PUJ35_08340 [Ruminococcus bromii]|nr:hypothetical protein [Ruminococcus bromii]